MFNRMSAVNLLTIFGGVLYIMMKLIVVDLDDTLLRTDKTISDYTRGVLKACRERGIKVIYATARGESAKEIIPTDMVDGRVIMTGAIAYVGEKLVYHRSIEASTSRDFLVACHDYGLEIVSESHEIHYSNFNVENRWKFIKNYKIVDFQSLNVNAEKIYTVIRDENDVDFINKHLPRDSYLAVNREKFAFIMHSEAKKMKAVVAIADYFGFKNEEIVAFGDDVLDMDILSQCGIGVAMENAIDEVKAVADEVCDSNDNDGVAKWLAKHLKLPS